MTIRKLRTKRDDQQWMLDLALNMPKKERVARIRRDVDRTWNEDLMFVCPLTNSPEDG